MPPPPWQSLAALNGPGMRWQTGCRRRRKRGKEGPVPERARFATAPAASRRGVNLGRPAEGSGFRKTACGVLPSGRKPSFAMAVQGRQPPPFPHPWRPHRDRQASAAGRVAPSPQPPPSMPRKPGLQAILSLGRPPKLRDRPVRPPYKARSPYWERRDGGRRWGAALPRC